MLMKPINALIIAPDDPGAEIIAETLKVEVLKVFDGDGFLADFFNPVRQKWVKRVPCRFAFIDNTNVFYAWLFLASKCKSAGSNII